MVQSHSTTSYRSSMTCLRLICLYQENQILHISPQGPQYDPLLKAREYLNGRMESMSGKLKASGGNAIEGFPINHNYKCHWHGLLTTMTKQWQRGEFPIYMVDNCSPKDIGASKFQMNVLPVTVETRAVNKIDAHCFSSKQTLFT